MRLFLAFSLSFHSEKRLKSAAENLEKSGVQGRFVPSAFYHVTIAFLAEQNEKTAEKLKTLVSSLVFEPCTVPVKSLSMWKGTLVLLLEDDPALKNTAKKIQSSLQDMDVHFDRKPFRPHITMARKTGLCAVDLKDLSQDFSVTLESICLYESRLTDKGALYTVLARSSKGKSADPGAV